MTHVSDLLAIALGGSIGAVIRYLITLAVVSAPLSGWLTLHGSVGTTLANLLGCFALGGIYQFTEIWLQSESLAGTDWFASSWGAFWTHPRTLLAIRIGALGSLTTFSTLIGETAIFASQGRMLASSVLLGTNVVVGWCLFWAAAAVVRNLSS